MLLYTLKNQKFNNKNSNHKSNTYSVHYLPGTALNA